MKNACRIIGGVFRRKLVTTMVAAVVVTGGRCLAGEIGGAIGLRGKMPDGYHLQFCDDCGVVGRQPHVPANTCHTFSPESVAADLKARTVAYGVPNFDAVYEGLNGNVAYVLAVTYASERGNTRVQSLSAGPVLLHGPHTLPNGSAERLVFKVPPEAIHNGRLTLHLTLDRGPNAVASVIELWAPLPSPPALLHLRATPTVSGKLIGSVTDRAYDAVAGVAVSATVGGTGERLGETRSAADGSFSMDLAGRIKPGAEGHIEVVARSKDGEAKQTVAASELTFVRPRFRPIPESEGDRHIFRPSGVCNEDSDTGRDQPPVGARSQSPAGQKGTVPICVTSCHVNGDSPSGRDSPSDWGQSLDGVWRLNASPGSSFATEATTGPGWANFTVPGQWLQQGFDVPRDRTVAVATDFQVPAAWAGKRIFLRFEAVHGGAEYWLNGVRLGSSENLFTPVEFDVTQVAKVGRKNHLALGIRVQTASEAASFSSDYAFHNLGGIDRSVRLFALPPTHFSEFHYETRLDDAYRDAVLVIHGKVTNATAANISADPRGTVPFLRHPATKIGTVPISMRLSLDGPDGVRVALPQDVFDLGTLKPGEIAVSERCPVAQPRKWSAEKPNLYKLTAELLENGVVVERLTRWVGFRRVEVRGSELWVNGTPVKLAGVCRHEIDPLRGRAATACHAEADARLLKGANFNFIRTSHYPPTQEFLDACDRVGLYVECEAPFCWTRGGRGEDDPAMTRQFLTPAAAMVDYHRDHPSVILWSLGNESGCGPDGENRLTLNFAEELREVRRMDPSRPTIFNNEWCKDGGACEVACLHYPPFPPEEYSFVKNDRRPIQLDEYFPPQTFTFVDELRLNPGLDVVNWSTGQNGPQSFWSQICASKRLCGGAIWAGIDEEFFFSDGRTKGYGPWGFVDVWRRPKSLWWDAKLMHAPVWIPVRRIEFAAGQRSVDVPVENRYSFTDLRELRTTWEVAGSTGELGVKLAPRSSGEIHVPLPGGTPVGSLLVLRFFDTAGRLITAHGVTLGAAPPRVLPQPGAGCPAWRDDGRTVSVSGKRFRLDVDRPSADFRGQDGKNVPGLIRYPRLFVSRQETKNVFNPGGVPYAQYPDESTRTIDAVSVAERGKALAIDVKDHYAHYAGRVGLLIDSEGVCSASFDYTYSGEGFTASEIGLRFLLEKRYHEITWRRQTEWDVYPEDHIGRVAGRAPAYRDAKWGNATLAYGARPPWPWHLDANEYGTRDFRAAKYNIFEAALLAPDGSGLRAESDGKASVRACLAEGAVQFHVLLEKRNARVSPGDRLAGVFVLRLLPPK